MSMNPGGDEAVKLGCTCPPIDNCHGEGYRHDPHVFWYADDCPVHCQEKDHSMWHFLGFVIAGTLFLLMCGL